MDDEDTEVGPAPKANGGRVSVMFADTAELALDDTDEWDDTDRDMFAQGTIDTSPQMFEDTGVVILDKPAEPAQSQTLVVTFRQPSVVTFREPTNSNARPAATAPRASTADEWPPAPRGPAQAAPQIRDRERKHAGIYTVVTRPDTKN